MPVDAVNFHIVEASITFSALNHPIRGNQLLVFCVPPLAQQTHHSRGRPILVIGF